MEEDYSNGLIDIVQGLREIDVDINGSPISEETQDGENIQLSNGDIDASEK